MRVRAIVSFGCAALAAGLCAVLVASRTLAETIIVNDKVTVRESNVARPKRGMRMPQVERQFGAPATRHPAVGKPPITRWDYPEFSVFFEHDIVIHSVVTGDHPAASEPGDTHPAGDDHPSGGDRSDHPAA
ncbi:MAG TPA: hypothetical protein VMD49_00815 [Steroidobacteraceae bacterium]|nr:hypothetical protein [Steroidobacteraceae bacterium]